MAATNTISTLDGLFKEVYGSSTVNLLPDFAILQRKVPFRPSERIGEGFAIPCKFINDIVGDNAFHTGFGTFILENSNGYPCDATG